MSRRAPRPLAAALRGVLAASGPPTSLARVQSAWRAAVGEAIALRTQPIAERQGTVTVACESATWAHELNLMHDELLAKLNETLEQAGAEVVSGLRFAADRARAGNSSPPRRR